MLEGTGISWVGRLAVGVGRVGRLAGAVGWRGGKAGVSWMEGGINSWLVVSGLADAFGWSERLGFMLVRLGSWLMLLVVLGGWQLVLAELGAFLMSVIFFFC